MMLLTGGSKGTGSGIGTGAKAAPYLVAGGIASIFTTIMSKNIFVRQNTNSENVGYFYACFFLQHLIQYKVF